MNILGLGISWMQLAVILLVASILVGPEKLPSYARKAAKIIRRIRKITSSVTSELSKSIGLDDEDSGVSSVKQDISDIRKSLEKDISDLKNTFSEQSTAISQSVESTTKEAVDSLQQNARDISKTINDQAGELKTAFGVKSEPVPASTDNAFDTSSDGTTDDWFGDTSAPENNAATVYEAEPKPVARTTIESPKDEPLSAPVTTPKDTIVTPSAEKESISG
ncbi:MAG: twin-arginine translocase TatA/TatE family subunit [Dehalococcoidia bacterium]|nr:twin-arginine translocase TatA/TatE family subunit [Dehalococcoidia bacterium]